MKIVDVKTVDVLVVGLGPAGGAAAAQAARAGLSVLAIDKKHRVGEPVQCAEFIPAPMGRYAQAPGVLHQRIEGMKSYLPSGSVEQSPFPGLMIDRAGFDRAFAEAAQAAGAELLLSTRLVALDARNAVATVANAEGQVELRYRALIAADGPHSSVARALNLPALDVVYTRQYTVPLLREYVDTDIWLSDDFPGGYGWLFPKGRTANLGLGADRAFEPNLKAPLERLHAHMAASGLVGKEILARTGGAIPVGGLRAKLTHGNIVFVGDAAGLTHPITGAGISAAVTSGERAADAAEVFVDSGDVAAFAEYESDIRDQFEPTLARAVARRQELQGVWRRPAASADAAMRRGWIAFNEYFAA